jgi:hypothetical protein
MEAQVLILTIVSDFHVILAPPARIRPSAIGFQLSASSFQFSSQLSERLSRARPSTLPAMTTFARANASFSRHRDTEQKR